MAKLSKELKDAISELPDREKDKLLFRLIAKDKALIDRLTYELLEGGDDPEERREELRDYIDEALGKGAEEGGYYTPGYLLLDLRHCNARITEHVKATKDKWADVELRLWMLLESMRRYRKMFRRFSERRSRTLAAYYVQRTEYILSKAEKLHEDYYLEIQLAMQQWLTFIWDFGPTRDVAEMKALPRKWPE